MNTIPLNHTPVPRKVFIDGTLATHLVASKMVRTWFLLEDGRTVPVSTLAYEAIMGQPGDLHLTEFTG